MWVMVGLGLRIVVDRCGGPWVVVAWWVRAEFGCGSCVWWVCLVALVCLLGGFSGGTVMWWVVVCVVDGWVEFLCWVCLRFGKSLCFGVFRSSRW